MVATLVGLALRIGAVFFAPVHSYLPDHLDNMAWGDWAWQHGPWNIYDVPQNQPILMYGPRPRQLPGPVVRVAPHACNYPPAAAYLFWLKGAAWNLLGEDRTALPVPERLIGIVPPGVSEVSSRLTNTTVARFADALPSLLFDFLMAWGIAWLVRALRLERPSDLAAAAAYAVAVVAPPIFLDSAFWNQADAWIGCLLVWTLYFLLRERFAWAGVLYGAALMTKAQAILLAPVLAYIFFALRFMPRGSWRRALGLLRMAAAAAVVAAFLALPFTIVDARKDNGEGAFRWFQRSYVSTLTAEDYNRTTMNAFNIWWLDYLSQGPPRGRQQQFGEFIDPSRTLLGIRKDRLGLGLLAASIVVTWVLCARRWRWAPESWLACAYLVLFASFLLPTKVHERYIYFCIPFLIALAVHSPRWLPALAALLIVGTFEMTSFRWAGEFDYRNETLALALLAVLAFVYSLVLLVPRVRPAAPAAPARGRR